MRVWLVGIFVCGILCPSLAAETNVNALYIPPKDGTLAKILDYDTGMMSSVLGTFEAQPADCPHEAYWVLSKDKSLVNCGDGNAYRLVKPPVAYSGFEGALKLEKITGGTDDGGPMAPKEPIK